LLKIRSTTFVEDEEVALPNPYFYANYTVPGEEKKQFFSFLLEESLIKHNTQNKHTQEDANHFSRMLKTSPNIVIPFKNEPQNPFATEATCGDDDNLDEITSMNSERENELFEQSEIHYHKEKRKSKKLDTLLSCLYEDLRIYTQLKPLVKKNSQELTGKMWLHIGAQSERLQKRKIAKKAYSKAIDKGFSLYALTHLANIYARRKQVEECLKCIIIALRKIILTGCKDFAKLPEWLEDIIFQLVAEHGLEVVKEFSKNLGAENLQPMSEVIERAMQWKVEGTFFSN